MPDELWDRQTEPEINDWRAALEWCLNGDGDRGMGQRLAAALRQVFRRLSPAEGLAWVEAALASTDAETPRRIAARLEVAKAMLAEHAGAEFVSVAEAARAIDLFAGLDDVRGTAEAQAVFASALMWHREFEDAEAKLRSALDSLRGRSERRLTALVLDHLAILMLEKGDVAEARRCFLEGLGIEREAGLERFAAGTASSLAEIDFSEGRIEESLAGLRDATATFARLGYPIYVCVNFATLAFFEILTDRWEDARQHASDALAIAREYGHHGLIAMSVLALAALATQGEAPVVGARLLGYAKSYLDRLGLEDKAAGKIFRQSAERLTQKLGEAEYAEFFAQGARWTEDEAAAAALAPSAA